MCCYYNTPVVIRLRGDVPVTSGIICGSWSRGISEMNWTSWWRGSGLGVECDWPRCCVVDIAPRCFKHLILTPKHHYVLTLAQLSFAFFPRRWYTRRYWSKVKEPTDYRKGLAPRAPQLSTEKGKSESIWLRLQHAGKDLLFTEHVRAHFPHVD